MCCNKTFNMTFLVIALLVGLLTCFPSQKMIDFVLIIRVFQAMLPVLAVGALLKYLFKQN